MIENPSSQRGKRPVQGHYLDNWKANPLRHQKQNVLDDRKYAIGLKISKKVMNFDQTLHSLGIQSLRTEKGGGPYQFELMIARGNTEEKEQLYSSLDQDGHLWSEPPFPLDLF
jgi:hypothetical protein